MRATLDLRSPAKKLRPGHLSPSWLAALRFTSVEKHPGRNFFAVT
jgi:hypothetical protein